MNNRKLRNLLHDKYREQFYANEAEWASYLHSMGCSRGKQASPNSIECPDSYHRVYTTHWIDVPEELAEKANALGFLP